MKKTTISVAVISLNEADRIGALLKSAKFADEVVVVDSGSTDGTRGICGEYKARVFNQTWLGYAAQKQLAMDKCTSEWILNLDADEEISRELEEEIKEAIGSASEDVNGFSMPRLSRYLGRWIRRGGWYPDRKLRLVRNGKGKWTAVDLHEKLEVEGKVQNLSSPILHHVYRDIYDQVETINKFSGLYAKTKGPSTKAFAVAGVFHAVGKFAECYLWKLGFLDGVPGLVIAMNSAWYVFLKHAKAWELGRA